VTEPDSLQQGDFEGVDNVIHLVAIIRQKGQATYEKVNYRGTVNIVEAAKKTGVKRFIHMSALGVVPDRRFPYLYTKWQGEEAVVNSGLAYTIFKPSTQFGEGDEFFNKLAIAVKMGPIVPIAGTGRTKFQPIWVEDTITCIIKALDDENAVGKTYEIGGPEHLTYEEMIDIVIETLGLKRAKLHLPVLMVYPVAAVMDSLMPNPLVTPRQLDLLALDNITDLDSVERHFGFKPKPLRGGMRLHPRRGQAVNAVLERTPPLDPNILSALSVLRGKWDSRGYASSPLVLGISPRRRGSIWTAPSRARASALKRASALWWSSSP